MEALFALLLLGSAWETHGRPKVTLTIRPEEALVERGGTIHLNCSMDCPGGKVQWEGLDTDLGNTASFGTSSVLTLTNTAIRMKGVKICTGQCQGQPKEKRVNLQVYSFPDTLRLDSSPKTLTAGQAAILSCSMSHVYPPGALTLSWWQGEEQLVPAGEVEETEMEGTGEQLFKYRSFLKVPRVPENGTYRCSAVLRLRRRVFRQLRNMTVSSQATPEVLRTTEGASSTFQTETTSHGTVPGLSTDSSSPSDSPSLFPTKNPTLVSSTVGKTSGFPLKFLAASTKHTEVTTHPMGLPLSPKGIPSSRTQTLSQMTKPLLKTMVISSTSKDLCRPVISPVPPQGNIGGALTITCLATDCGKDVQLWWAETPVHQSQYQREEGEGWSTLTINSLSEDHQGIYRCVTLTGQSRVASLRIEVSDPKIKTGSIVALGTTGSLLGLAITGYVSHRLRRR